MLVLLKVTTLIMLEIGVMFVIVLVKNAVEDRLITVLIAMLILT